MEYPAIRIFKREEEFALPENVKLALAILRQTKPHTYCCLVWNVCCNVSVEHVEVGMLSVGEQPVEVECPDDGSMSEEEYRKAAKEILLDRIIDSKQQQEYLS